MAPAAEEAATLIAQLGDRNRSFPAYQRLLKMGDVAAAAARDGLSNPDPRVRSQCCRVLDHVFDAESIPYLVAALADPHEAVRIDAAHALACDRCKGDSCGPPAEAVLPPALALLATDPSAHARAMVIELVGAWVHTHPEVVGALMQAAK